MAIITSAGSMETYRAGNWRLNVATFGLRYLSVILLCTLSLPAIAEPMPPLAFDDDESVDTQSVEASSSPNFKRIIIEQYFALWRDTDEDPYSADEAQQLYVTDERLTSFDLEAASEEGADSRADGWSEYSAGLADVFDGISRYEVREVTDFQVRQEDSLAVTTFDAAIDIELEKGEAFVAFKHFTLVWIATEDGWRIVHEHLSNGKPPEALSS